jgi:hypothetical protein
VKQYYAMRVSTILHAAEKLSSDLDYLCAIVEQPDPEFPVTNALAYARAVTTMSNHLDFILEDLSERDLNEDQDHVKLSEEDVVALSVYTEAAEEALALLERTCGISLQNN